MNRIKVSACIITYNHEQYLRECLEGAVNQNVNFDYEIIIGQDNSTDDTHKICLEYADLYPDLIKYYPREKNLGMIGNWIETINQCNGKYIALCEGDDYWTDPLKLQKQVNFLEMNEDYVLTFHPIKILKPDGSLVEDHITTVPDNYEIQETLARLGNYIHTPSVVFRNVIQYFPPEFKLAPFCDFFLYMMLTNYGKVKMIDNSMAVYRYGVGIISKMDDLTIANNNVRLYSCMLSALDNFEIKKVIFERQLMVVSNHYKQFEDKYKYTIFLPKWYVNTSIRMSLFYNNPKETIKRIKKKIMRT